MAAAGEVPTSAPPPPWLVAFVASGGSDAAAWAGRADAFGGASTTEAAAALLAYVAAACTTAGGGGGGGADAEVAEAPPALNAAASLLTTLFRNTAVSAEVVDGGTVGLLTRCAASARAASDVARVKALNNAVLPHDALHAGFLDAGGPAALGAASASRPPLPWRCALAA